MHSLTWPFDFALLRNAALRVTHNVFRKSVLKATHRVPMALTALVLGACSSTITTPNAPIPGPTQSSAPGTPLQHVIIVFQENRSFNNLFMKFPGADTSTIGRCVPYTPPGFKEICNDPDPQKRVVRMHPITLETCGCLGGTDISHTHASLELEYNGGKMDGFDRISLGT